MRHERMTAFNIGALVVSFIGLTGNLKATAWMTLSNGACLYFLLTSARTA